MPPSGGLWCAPTLEMRGWLYSRLTVTADAGITAPEGPLSAPAVTWTPVSGVSDLTRICAASLSPRAAQSANRGGVARRSDGRGEGPFGRALHPDGQRGRMSGNGQERGDDEKGYRC
ncbi:hypothetical protein GCM10020219_075950 [Nonomuraea dietziae]